MSNLESIYEVEVGPPNVREVDRDAVELGLEPLRVSVAQLSDEDIRRLDDVESVAFVKLSGLFSTREWVQFMDQDELEQMAFQARRLCREEVNAAYKKRGTPAPFTDDLRSPF